MRRVEVGLTVVIQVVTGRSVCKRGCGSGSFSGSANAAPAGRVARHRPNGVVLVCGSICRSGTVELSGCAVPEVEHAGGGEVGGALVDGDDDCRVGVNPEGTIMGFSLVPFRSTVDGHCISRRYDFDRLLAGSY
jgi:hypothetical protein